jgi:hypothetical protein
MDRSPTAGPLLYEPGSPAFLMKNKSYILINSMSFTPKTLLSVQIAIQPSVFDLHLISSPVNLQSSPHNFKTLYLFNRNSVFSEFCAKSSIVTKAI